MTEVCCEYLEEFEDLVKKDVAVPVCAMKALLTVIKKSEGTTWMQLEKELGSAIRVLKECKSEVLMGKTKISLGSGCDLFMKYVTRAFLEFTEFDVCKKELVRRGESFAGMSEASRTRIAEIGHSFVQDGCTVLTHGYSRVVMALLLKAAAEAKQFNVIVTEAGSQGEGQLAAAMFVAAGIPTRLIADCAVGTYMERVNLCIVGAEGVMENGGIVNKTGTYQVSMIAKILRRPFYVAVESYKFARMYPLSQTDVADMCAEPVTVPGSTSSNRFTFAAQHTSCPRNTEADTDDLPAVPCDSSAQTQMLPQQPVIDFTPAAYISLLFTDLGILTPAAVSDELIRLYQ